MVLNQQRNGLWGEARMERYAKRSRTQPFALDLKCDAGNRISVQNGINSILAEFIS